MKYKAAPFEIWGRLYLDHYDTLCMFRIEFSGRMDVEALKEAITLSKGTLPHIACGFTLSKAIPCWDDRGYTGVDMVVTEAEEVDLEAQANRFFNAPFDYLNGPQLKTLVVRREGGDMFCGILNHLITDIGGLKEYLHILSLLYTAVVRGEEPPKQACLPRDIKPVLKRFSLGEKWKALTAKHEGVFRGTEKEKHGVDFKCDNPTQYRERRILADGHFQDVKQFSRTHGVTINDLLMAAFARAYAAKTGRTKLFLPSTIDLRQELPPGSPIGLGNYSTDVICEIDVKEGDPLEDTAKQVSKNMKEIKSQRNWLKHIIMLNLSSRVPTSKKGREEIVKNIKISDILVTNYGILSKSSMQFDSLDMTGAYRMCLGRIYQCVVLMISTFENRCTMCLNIYGDEEARVWVLDFLERIGRDIEMAVGL